MSQARVQIEGFAEQINKFEKKLSILGRSRSTFLNYSRHLAKMSLHFKCLPTELDEDQITDYLHLLKQEHNTPTDSYFKHTVFGLRMLCNVEHIKPHDIGLRSIKRPNKLPVVLSKAEMWSLLQAPDIEVEQSTYDALFKKEWVVYAKRPFGSPKSVVEYLGRYTHKIAISNHRILSIDDQSVSISYKDYREEGQKKTMTLSHEEFVRRFALHILPKRFVRIRHYGFLSSTWKRFKLTDLQCKLTTINLTSLPVVIKGSYHKACPY